MGLPRYLKNIYESDVSYWNSGSEEAVADGMKCALLVGADLHKYFSWLFTQENISLKRLLSCLIVYRFRCQMIKQFKSKDDDNMEKVQVYKYLGLELKGGELIPITKKITVSRFFAKKLVVMDAELEGRDRKKVKLRDEIIAVKDRVYITDRFPQKLRTIILERDGYTCQLCGRHRNVLVDMGLHLEVDHKIAWMDGGQTTYKNAQTLCSECNKGKHHAKPYFRAIDEDELE